MGKILSVFFTNENIRICELKGNNKNATVCRAFDEPIPSGIIEDGMIMDTEEAARCLRATLKNNGIKRGKIAFIISSRRIANKEVTVPFVKNPKKMEEMILANVNEYFPMNNLEDYEFRYNLLDTVAGENGKQSSVLVMAIQKQMIAVYEEVAGLLKMPIETIDYYGNSIYQLLRRQLTSQGTILALQMDRTQTHVSIMRGTAQLFKRAIPFGRDSIARNMMEKKQDMTMEEALSMLSDSHKMELLLTEEEYKELIRELTSSITRVVDFHVSRNPDTVIDSVKLMGTGLDIAGFTEALSEDLGIEVQEVRELNGIKIKSARKNAIDFDDLVNYLPNLGVLFAPLNLKVEKESAKKKKKGGGYGFFIFLIILATLAVAGVCAVLILQEKKLNEEKKKLENDISRYTTAEASYNTYLSAKKTNDIIKDYYNSTKNPTEMLHTMILDLERIMPESMGITDLTVKNGEVEITGVSNGKDALAMLVMELKKLPYISDVRVDDILDTTTELGGITSTYNMKWRLNLPRDAEEEEEGGTQE